MISLNTVFSLESEEIVPVRSIPFVTGGDIGPRQVAVVLSDPQLNFSAFVLAQDGTATRMIAKEWKRTIRKFTQMTQQARDQIDRSTLEVLPPSTFVYWEGLWKTYSELVIQDREALAHDPAGEKENRMLMRKINIPRDLVEVIFAGFSEQASTKPNVQKPVPRSLAQEDEILAIIKNKGYDPLILPMNQSGLAGVKAEMRMAIGSKGMWSGSTVFDKAWGRLLAKNRIFYSK